MGTASRRERHSPKRLAEKLLETRLKLGLSQNELLHKMRNPDSLQQASISGYELGRREPPLLIILKYAELANVYVDVLLNDSLNLPENLPTQEKSAGISAKR